MKRRANPNVFWLLALAAACNGTEGNVLLEKDSAADATASDANSPPADSGPGPARDGAGFADAVAPDATAPADASTLDSGVLPGICVDPRRVQFAASPGGTATMTVTIGACGTRALTVAALDWSVADAEIDLAAPPSVPFTLQPGGAQAITVRYQPTDAVSDSATLIVRSDDPGAPEISVAVTGAGAGRTVCGPDGLSCDRTTEICVETIPAGPAIGFACRPVPAGCENDRSCACTSAALCHAPFNQCFDQADNRISCECPVC